MPNIVNAVTRYDQAAFHWCMTRRCARDVALVSSAEAIERLEIVEVMHEFNLKQLREWLGEECPCPRSYPDVARAIVEWIASGMSQDERPLAERLWHNCLQFQLSFDDEPEPICP